MEKQQLDFEPDPELFAIYNSLGYLQDGVYYKEPDCNACLKDLLRFMRSENQHTFSVRRQLGKCNFLTTDLGPLVKQYCLKDSTLFDYVIRLLTALTTPPILLFKEQVPDDKEARRIYLDLQQYVFEYKSELSGDIMFWSVIAKQMLKILQMDLDKRQEEDKVLLERMLILIRNVLHVASQDEEDVIAGEDNTHDKLLIAMKKACIYDILIYICQTAAEHEFSFHVLEIFSLMYREQNAEQLATLTDSLRLSEAEKRKDIEHLKELKARTRSGQANQDKFQRFKESTYVIKNLKSIGNNDVICHKAVSDISELNLDQNKKVVRKAKNRRHFQDQSIRNTHSSSLELRSYLRELATTLISTSYNLLMKTIRFYLERSKSQENDETYFIWAAQFFMEFNRCASAKVDFVMETLSKEYLHYLHCLIESHLDHLRTDKKNVKLWSKRLHLGLKAYKELIYTLAHLQSKFKTESSTTSIAEELKRKLFYEEEYRELIRLLIMVYDPIKMSDGYLNDLIEANHLFLKMLEYYCKKSENQVMIRKKTRKQKKKKKASKDNELNEQVENEQPELIWTELAAEISNVLQSDAELPRIEDNPDLNVFNVLSEESKDEQKLTVMKKINLLLYAKRAEESVAVFREARNFFNDDPDDTTFGTFDIQLDEELLALQNILMNDFLLDCNKDEFKKLKEKEQPNEDENNDQEDANLIDEEEEEEESDDDEKRYKEQVFNFGDFVKSFANQKILQPYCLAFQKYETNSVHVNSCIIKMFHRLAFDCLMYCMFFQLSFFRTIQNIFKDHHDNVFYSELIRFGKFVIGKFTQVVKSNPNVFIEMLYSKSNKEAYIVEHGHEEVKETKEPKSRGRKKKNNKNNGEDDEFIKDKYSESEEEGTAAERYDKLFGNKKKVNLESTRLGGEHNESVLESDLDDDDKLVIDDKATQEDNAEPIDENWAGETDRIPDEVIERRKAKRAKFLAFIKEQNSQEEAKSKRKRRATTKKRKANKFDDSDNDDSFDAAVNRTENQLESSKESNKELELSHEKKSTRRQFLDSDDEDSNDKQADDKTTEDKTTEDKPAHESTQESHKSSPSDEESMDVSIKRSERKSNEFIESDNEDDESLNKLNESSTKKRKVFDSDDEDSKESAEAAKINETKTNKRKIIDSDDEDENQNSEESSKLTEMKNKRRKVFDSDEEENANEKENLSSQSNNLESNNVEKVV